MKKLFRLIAEGLFPQFSFMKKLFSKRGRQELELDGINEKLSLAVIEQSREKRVLRRKIIKHFHSKKKGNSRFIKSKPQNPILLKKECERIFGEEMKSLNLKLTDNLELK